MTSSWLHPDLRVEKEHGRPLDHAGGRAFVLDAAQTLVWSQRRACVSAVLVVDHARHRDPLHHLDSSCRLAVFYLASQALAGPLPEERASAILKPLLSHHAHDVVLVLLPLWSHHVEIVLLDPSVALQPLLNLHGHAAVLAVQPALLQSRLGNVAMAYDPWHLWSPPTDLQHGRLSCGGVAPLRSGRHLQEVACHGCNAL